VTPEVLNITPQEDDPSWDCEIHGNQECGPVQTDEVTPLPTILPDDGSGPPLAELPTLPEVDQPEPVLPGHTCELDGHQVTSHLPCGELELEAQVKVPPVVLAHTGTSVEVLGIGGLGLLLAGIVAGVVARRREAP
jgi:LPXTG-motif cell wall-anchored protein